MLDYELHKVHAIPNKRVQKRDLRNGPHLRGTSQSIVELQLAIVGGVEDVNYRPRPAELLNQRRQSRRC